MEACGRAIPVWTVQDMCDRSVHSQSLHPIVRLALDVGVAVRHVVVLPIPLLSVVAVVVKRNNQTDADND